MIISIEYELQCSCGAVKHEKGFSGLFQWYLKHDPERQHKITVMHFLNNKVRTVREEEITEFIRYIKEDLENDEHKHPFSI